ncbi:MAG TPA: hypothetical protein VN628_13270 [Vicinamibacterales bacterium]|nr:hypothetical protein [Vicinamibacterales bacterium]
MKTAVLVLLLAAAAAALYTTRLSDFPRYPARDEVMSGDLAQSIVPTGRDLDGNRLTASGWAVVKTVSEPTGQPVFVIVEKR